MKTFGYIKSKLDGTEYEFKPKQSIQIPEKFSYQNILKPIINQGNQNICVSCSIDCFLNFQENIINQTPKFDNKIHINYVDMTSNGIQIKQALSQLYHQNIISGYYKVGNFEIAKIALMVNGPLIIGLPVYNSSITKFWLPNYNREIEGYHAVAIVGFNTQGMIIRNSWGTSYGQKGYAIIDYSEVSNVIELWSMAK